ncbi:hypothetical protein [Nocardia sp. alder85J]|uniref:PPE domain-containing protein n=1 Tax=Nocardia sp. alder85J TaxID=2862949 RepID=UPI001CD1B5AA|nr:hypothetical protein [Nocardia sp. alder85J]MCX4095969.1 hypothetical protein [Nocardia sp. alder85J]
MHKISGPGGPGATDPDYAPTVEVFDNLSYEDIHRGVAQLDPAVLTAGRQAWQGSAAAVAEAVQQAHAEIRGVVADGWRGRAAVTAAEAVRAFEEFGRHLSDVMAEVGQRLGQANDAAETLRASVSRSPAGRPDLEGALLDPRRAVTNVAVQKAAEDARQEAVRVMNTVYAGVFLPTGSGIPAFDEGGLYPAATAVAPAAPPPGNTGGDAPEVATIATVPGATALPEPPAGPADRDRPESGSREGDFDTVASTGTAVPGAAATSPSSVVAPASVAAGAVPAASGHPAGPVAPQPDRPIAPSPGVPLGVATPTRGQSSDPRRDRDDRDRRRGTDTAATGSGLDNAAAGVIGGGLAGSAFAVGDLARSGPAATAPRPLPFEEEDEDEFYDDDLTFLEPPDPGTDLVGEFEPTTPPVLGEWA